jgi:hypothetical protein
MESSTPGCLYLFNLKPTIIQLTAAISKLREQEERADMVNGLKENRAKSFRRITYAFLACSAIATFVGFSVRPALCGARTVPTGSGVAGPLASVSDSTRTTSNAAAACSAELWTPPIDSGGAGVQALLKSIPITTKWADIPIATKSQLQKLADDRLAAFRARWADAALAKKQMILLGCPTLEMSSAIDDYYRKTYNSFVPASFSLKDLKSAPLARALVRNYLGTIAASRATLTYPNENSPIATGMESQLLIRSGCLTKKHTKTSDTTMLEWSRI